MDVVCLAAYKVARYRHQASCVQALASEESYVCSVWAGLGLDGVAYYRSLSEGAAFGSHVNEDVGGVFEVGVVVVFDVVADYLEVSHLASEQADAGEAIVADVAVGDYGLVQIDAVEVDADLGVVVDVAVVDDEVAIAYSLH